MTIVDQVGVANSKTTRRRRLNPDQEREIARLYAENGTSTAEIRKRFGIGDSSLYRVMQKLRVPLRGRGRTEASNPPTAPSARVQATLGLSKVGGSPAPVSVLQSAAPKTSVRTRRPTGSASVTGRAKAATQLAPSRSGSGRRQFRIVFKAERVFEAQDILDALRQAESVGATEITAVTRLDQP